MARVVQKPWRPDEHQRSGVAVEWTVARGLLPPRHPPASRSLWTIALALALVGSALVTLPPVAAEATGSLAPPHQDVGVDTNSDRFYNYLRIDVRIEVTQAGRFSVLVRLNDPLDLAELTNSSTSAYLSPGYATVQVFLNGPDIYNGFVDGPYYAHITLKSEYGTVLSVGTHTTAAYKYTDFQPYAIRFVSPVSERTVDNDTDGLYDWLTLTLTLDVTTEDNYVVSSRLVDQTYKIREDWRTAAHLLPGRTSVTQYFLGYPLRLANASGPYLVTNDIYDGRGVQVDFLLYTTAAYSSSSFEGPPVTLAPPHSEWALDTDGDGLYSALQVNVSLLVDRTETVVLSGELRSGDGALLIETLEVRPTLGAGHATVALYFAGPIIYSKAVNGPYQVRLRVEDLAGRILSEGLYSTQSYKYTQFESRSLQLKAPHADAGIDADGDGLYEVLRLSVYVSVEIAGTYRFSAILWDGSMALRISEASRDVSLGTGLQAVPLDFQGSVISASGIDGPYRVTINVHDAATGTLLDSGGHRTKGYLASLFESGVTGTIQGIAREHTLDTESSPDGYANILRLYISVNVGLASRYRLEGNLSAGGAKLSSSATTASLPAGASELELSFSGWELRAGARDGPFAVALSLTGLNSTAALLLDTTALTTLPYAVSAFQPAGGATVSGRVLSSDLGKPLAQAEVWAVNYSNAFSRRAFADDQGNFVLSLFPATYRLVVDHKDGQARASALTVSGDSTMNFTLSSPFPNTLETRAVWQTWIDLNIFVRYVLTQDAAALRLRLDWDLGDRDGIVEASEEDAMPALPTAPAREALEAGATDNYLLVNAAPYVSQGPLLYQDDILGSAISDTTPSFEMRRAFRMNFSMSSPPKVDVFVRVLSDTPDWNRRDLLFLPGSYRFVSYTASDWVYVYARRSPYTVDPQQDPNASGTPTSDYVDILLYRNAYAVLTTPSSPSGLSAKLQGRDVSLEWVPPSTNMDGSRISNLAGYHVYRSSSSGSGYVRVDSVLVMTTSLLDVAPPSGTYYYVVTAVNTDGRESAWSNEVNVTVFASAAGGSGVDTVTGPPLLDSGALSLALLAVAIAAAIAAKVSLPRRFGKRGALVAKNQPHGPLQSAATGIENDIHGTERASECAKSQQSILAKETMVSQIATAPLEPYGTAGEEEQG